MTVEYAHCFFIAPQKGKEEPDSCKYATIKKRSKLYSMLSDLFDKSPRECRIPIVFTSDKQANETRTLILDGIDGKTPTKWLPLADYLSSVTTNVSGLGLFFVIVGTEGGKIRTVLARFPADTAILADTQGDRLQVELIERVFMKNSKSYKAVTYEAANPSASYWEGLAIDKQIHGNITHGSNYWIGAFLRSNYKTDPKVGSLRLADAIKKATQSDISSEARAQIVGAQTLLAGLDGNVISPIEFCNRYTLGEEARNAVLSNIKPEKLRDEAFQFVYAEYRVRAPIRQVSLDNGVSIAAPSGQFDELVDRVADENDRQTYSTSGVVTKDIVRGNI